MFRKWDETYTVKGKDVIEVSSESRLEDDFVDWKAPVVPLEYEYTIRARGFQIDRKFTPEYQELQSRFGEDDADWLMAFFERNKDK